MLKQVYDFLATRLRIHKDDMRLWKFKDEVKVNLFLRFITAFVNWRLLPHFPSRKTCMAWVHQVINSGKCQLKKYIQSEEEFPEPFLSSLSPSYGMFCSSNQLFQINKPCNKLTMIKEYPNIQCINENSNQEWHESASLCLDIFLFMISHNLVGRCHVTRQTWRSNHTCKLATRTTIKNYL